MGNKGKTQKFTASTKLCLKSDFNRILKIRIDRRRCGAPGMKENKKTCGKKDSRRF
jgi:hypothetical protein